MDEAIGAYYKVTAEDKLRELERSRHYAEMNRSSSMNYAIQGEREKWKGVVAEKDATLAKNAAALAQKDTVIATKDTALTENAIALAQKDTVIATKNTALAEKDAALAENAALIAELRAQLGEKPWGRPISRFLATSFKAFPQCKSPQSSFV